VPLSRLSGATPTRAAICLCVKFPARQIRQQCRRQDRADAGHTPQQLILATVIGYGAGTWLGTLVPVIRFLTPTERMHHKVRLRAERAFAQHAVTQTRERTGVLIMVSLLEHEIYVLPDQPLFQRVPKERWTQVVQAAVDRLKTGDLVGGLCQGIKECGVLLAEICPGRPGDNPNELPNELIQEP
jgi:putative membrane protein